MAKIIYEVYQNQNEHNSAYGKWYGRVKYLESLNTRKLSNHIAEHGSIYTPDIVYGVMEKFRSCLLEMLLNSKKVKIEGLGTFYTTLECKKGGAVSKEKFNILKDIQGLHIRFLPEQEQEQNISSRQFLKQAEFINIDSLLPKEEEAEGGNGGGNSGGSENGGSQSGEQGGNGGSQNGGSQSEQGGSQSGQQGEQNQGPGFALTISKTGTGTASVTSGGNAVNSGDSLSEDAEVEISITPAEGKVPTASVNGSSIELTESEGVYEGSFAMPGQASSLVIETGTAEGGDSGDGIDKD
jgi:predicted histone-like DNA-binding protein